MAFARDVQASAPLPVLATRENAAGFVGSAQVEQAASSPVRERKAFREAVFFVLIRGDVGATIT